MVAQTAGYEATQMRKPPYLTSGDISSSFDPLLRDTTIERWVVSFNELEDTFGSTRSACNHLDGVIERDLVGFEFIVIHDFSSPV